MSLAKYSKPLILKNKSWNNVVKQYAVLGNGIVQNNRLLEAFLQSYSQTSVKINQLSLISLNNVKQNFLLGWGRKKSYYRAKQFGKHLDIPVLTLEDGFLRSLDTGQASRYAYSMVIDPIGIYFDSREPSLLETLIINTILTNNEESRINQLINIITTENLSKYNTTAKTGTLTGLDFTQKAKNILLIDQVAGDQSIIGANADEMTFQKMLQTACRNHPDATIWIKAHPASRLGYLTALPLPKNCQIIRQTVNPIELLKAMDEVYTVSSQMGFEALMLGKTVHCFGLSWYSAWGLTNDSHIQDADYHKVWQRRGAKKTTSLSELFDAFYLQYSHYANPATAQPCEIEDILHYLISNRNFREQLASNITVYEFSKWKHGFVKDFLASSQAQLFFKPKFHIKTVLNPKHINFPKHNPFLVWGFAKKTALSKKLNNSHAEIWCMEDGFIRSNGLGASLIAPLSVVLDKTGIYYNALQTSDLERFLQEKLTLTPTQSERVQQLIQRLLTAKVSKYNVGVNTSLSFATEKTKILVIGQVEDDMSVKLCASDIKDNLSLLKQVRADNPNAFIIYKPHPDVQAGLRMGKVADDKVYQFADTMLNDTHISDCLDAVDEVHTISSLTGFEALLRGLKVVCYGLPFYAGFGLTVDKADNPHAQRAKQRRSRQTALTLEQLVYTVLIDYPLYRLPHGYGLAQVEDVVDFLYNDMPTLQKANPMVSNRLTSLAKNRLKPHISRKFMQGRRKFQEASQLFSKK